MKKNIVLLTIFVTAFQPNASYACRMAPPIPTLSDELVNFNSCQELDSHVSKLLAKGQYGELGYIGKKEVLRQKVSSERAAGAPSSSMAADKDEGISALAGVGPAKPESKTGTNNQVENVDEADFVKFNGRHIYQLHNGTLRILKAWPANELNQIASMAFTGQPQEMLINDSNAVILSSEGAGLKAAVVDIRTPTQPKILTEFEIPAQYRTARLVGDTLRIVSQDFSNYEMTTRTEVPSNSWFQEEVTSRKLNIKPTIQSINGTRRTLDVVRDCKNVYVPKDMAPQVLTRIISIDLKQKKYEETLAYVQPETVYASENAIFLAQSGYNYNDGLSTQKTAVHKFSIPKGSTALYQASGIVNGHLINQFAMDEHKSYLRIATTGSELTGKNIWGNGGQWQLVSRVQVLSQVGKRLKSVGQTDDLGRGERLYSARFDGEKGYVVTFRQVDPLFTIDLRNPYRPRVAGELKVPGFSTYIHMFDKNHLLTVGQDADEQTGRTRGLKLSLFDVRDFGHPREVKSLIFKSGVSSESSYEHKAFSFYREKGILAIPATQGTSQNSLLLFRITTSEIKSAGEITMSDLQAARRSFFADNFIYAIGGLGVRAATIENPQTPIGTVFFDRTYSAEANW